MGSRHLLHTGHFAIEAAGVIWIRRSASVDLPWSIWATMEKLRMLEMGAVVMGRGIAFTPHAATMLRYFKGVSSRQADSTGTKTLRTGPCRLHHFCPPRAQIADFPSAGWPHGWARAPAIPRQACGS